MFVAALFGVCAAAACNSLPVAPISACADDTAEAKRECTCQQRPNDSRCTDGSATSDGEADARDAADAANAPDAADASETDAPTDADPGDAADASDSAD